MNEEGTEVDSSNEDIGPAVESEITASTPGPDRAGGSRVAATLDWLPVVVGAALVALAFVSLVLVWRTPQPTVDQSWSPPEGRSLSQAERQLCDDSRTKLRPFTVTAAGDGPNELLFDRSAIGVADRSVNFPPPELHEGKFAALSGFDLVADIRVISVDFNSMSAKLQVVLGPWDWMKAPARAELPQNYEVKLLFKTDNGDVQTDESKDLLINGYTRQSVEVPISGDQSAYPSDIYSITNIRIVVNGYDLDTGDRYARSVGTVRVWSTPGTGAILEAYPGFEVDAQSPQLDILCSAKAQLTLRRPTTGNLFRWTVALLPVVLILLLLGLALTDSFKANGMVETAAALLAVLPLRAVLVPSSITSITRVDAVLGAQLVLMVAILAFGQWRSRWFKRHEDVQQSGAEVGAPAG